MLLIDRIDWNDLNGLCDELLVFSTDECRRGFTTLTFTKHEEFLNGA